MEDFGRICLLILLFFLIKTTNPHVPPNNGGNNNHVNQVPCGSTLEVRDGMTYIILSPGYPNAYSPFSSCQWNFYTRTSSSLTIDCQAFQLESSTDCTSKAFLVIDPGDKQYQWYCGNNGPKSLRSKTNYMSVFFWGNWQNNYNYQGFYCNVKTNFYPPTPQGGSCRCGQRQPRNRIIGGDEAGVHEFPWMALVKLPIGICGGALINERFVLTAAHCIDSSQLPNGALPTVVLGEHNLILKDETSYTIEMQASAVWPHEKYYRNESISIKDYDIGLVELERAVSLTNTPNIAPACAPNPLKSYDEISVLVAGWGYTSFPTVKRSDVLMRAELETVPLSKCKTDYPSGIITNKMICAHAEGKDACFDDSGAPLIARESNNWVVIGIVAFGPASCAHATKSGVYTRVSDYIPWIISKIGNARTCPP